MRKTLQLIVTYLRMLTTALAQYYREAIFFVAAKSHYLNGQDKDFNPTMLLKKRTHHLERFLFSPDKYKSGTGEKAAQDLRYILAKNASDVSAPLKAWAMKILHEYETGISRDSHGQCFCPMLLGGVSRPNESVSKDALMGLMVRRRSRRVFEQTKLTQEEKESICNAAQWAPSSCNRQPIYLLFVEDLELKKYVAATIAGGEQFFSEAPAIVILSAEAGDYPYPSCRHLPFMDGGLAIQNIYLICETMGLGCCIGSYTSFGGVEAEKEIRKKLKIPATHIILASLAIGKSNQCVCPIPRENPNSRLFVDYYGVK